MSTPGTGEYGLRSSALCVDGLGTANGGLRRTLATGAEMCMGAACLTADIAPTPCRGVRLTGQTPEPTNAHAQSDTGPDIADHAPASSTSHAGPTLSSARQGGCCLVGGRNRCDSEDGLGRGPTLVRSVVPRPCVVSALNRLDVLLVRVPVAQGKMKAMR